MEKPGACNACAYSPMGPGEIPQKVWRKIRDIPEGPRLQVILDLDATLINSLSVKDEKNLVPLAYQKMFKYHDMPKYYRIFERPHLQDFLDYLFANFDVSVFTAADKDYALFITEKIILKSHPERRLKHIFVGTHSAMSENYYKSPKDLRMLWDMFHIEDFFPCQTVIIDDLKEVQEANPERTIVAPKFELLKDGKVDYTQAHDTFLLQVQFQLEDMRQKFLASPCSHFLGMPHAHACTTGSCRQITTVTF